MDPISLGLLMAFGAGGAAAAVRWRKRRSEGPGAKPATPSTRAEPRREPDPGALKVGDVLLWMGDEFWLSGELRLVREGAAVLRVFTAPEKGRDRWLALTAKGDQVYILDRDAALEGIGWPGMEVPSQGQTLRPVEQSPCAITPSGEVEPGWEGVGRYAVFRAMETVAVFIEQGRQRIALRGKSVPRRLIEKLG
jgi:hypothetical protein